MAASAMAAEDRSFPEFSEMQKSIFLESRRSSGTTFSHPYFPYPRENVIFGDICPRAFFLLLV
jgi:hypothetical protein